MPPKINNIMLSAGDLVNFTGTIAGAQSRVAKKKKEAKKAKRLAFETPKGLRDEVARIRAAADKEEEEVRRKREKANRLLQMAKEMEQELERASGGEIEVEEKAGEEGEVLEKRALELRQIA